MIEGYPFKRILGETAITMTIISVTNATLIPDTFSQQTKEDV
jgi:hypothetical protein